MTQTNDKKTGQPRVVVMTGGTAGLGAHALTQITQHTRVILGCRTPSRGHGDELQLDLASLTSTRSFASETLRVLGGVPIDVLVLNAGASFPGTPQQTEDGFEAAFGINHLAHYLLARLLLPHMASQGKLIITTSDVHAQAPPTLDAGAWSKHPPGGSGMKAYAASKLCNLLTARALAVQEEVKSKSCEVIAYNPGLTVGTALSRNAPGWMRVLMNNRVLHFFLYLGSTFVPMMYPGSPERAGEALAGLALGTVVPPQGRIYASLVRGELTYPDPSALANNDNARDTLWRDSAEMVDWRI